MSINFKKKFALVFAFYILFSSLHLPLFKVYADSETVNYQEIKSITQFKDEDILKDSNEKSIGAVATLIPSALPGFLKIMQVFMTSLVFIDSWENGLVGGVKNLISSIIDGSLNTEVKEFFSSKLETAQSATIAFLVAYDNFSSSTNQIVSSVRTTLLKYYQEEFLVTLENALAQGVNIATLTTYGVTKFFDLDIFNQVHTSLPTLSSFPALKGQILTNEGYGSKYANRLLNFNDIDVGYGVYNMSAGYDLEMQFVDKVQITRNNVEEYNFGWDGLSWTQQYYMKTASDGLQYMIVFSIAKALSPNQRLDYKHDGLSFGLYQVNELGEVVKGNANNVYYRSADSRLNTLVPSTGTNLYKGSSVGIDFGKLRDICVDLWGADVFPNVPDVWDLSFDCTSDTNRLVDYSKNEPGIYDNEWNYQGTPVYPIPGVDIPINFPTLKPGSGVGVSGKPINPTWDDLFPPTDFPGVDVYVPGTSVPDVDIPDVDVPETDIPETDVPDVDVPETDTPDVSIPGLDSILEWLNKFWDMLLEFLKSILIPSDTYWIDNFNKLETSLNDKLPGVEIDRLKDLFTSERPFEDIVINYKGHTVPIVKLSLMNDFIGFARPIIQGVIVLFLLLYNYNQIYFLLRGSSLLGSQNTIDNMERGKVGGRK